MTQWLQQAGKVADPNSHLSSLADELSSPTVSERSTEGTGAETALASGDDKAIAARKKRKGVFIDQQLKASGKRKPKP